MADKIIVDSKKQALHFGDSFHAIKANIVDIANIDEIGAVLQNKAVALQRANRIISDLTGIAAQDIAISKYALNNLNK